MSKQGIDWEKWIAIGFFIAVLLFLGKYLVGCSHAPEPAEDYPPYTEEKPPPALIRDAI